MPRKTPLRAILFVIIGTSLLLVGGVFSLVIPIGAGFTYTGYLPFMSDAPPGIAFLAWTGAVMMTFGVVMMVAVAGLFDGAPFRTFSYRRMGPGFMSAPRVAGIRRADEELRRREEERYSD